MLRQAFLAVDPGSRGQVEPMLGGERSGVGLGPWRVPGMELTVQRDQGGYWMRKPYKESILEFCRGWP